MACHAKDFTGSCVLPVIPDSVVCPGVPYFSEVNYCLTCIFYIVNAQVCVSIILRFVFDKTPIPVIPSAHVLVGGTPVKSFL